VRSACKGNGACGLCRVRLENVGAPISAIERLHLDSEQLRQGWRLACQFRPQEDLSVEILSAAPRSAWKRLPPQAIPLLSQDRSSPIPSEHVRTPYGVAIDVGTSCLSVSLHDLYHQQLLSSRYGPNPQSSFGRDVISRLIAASHSEAQARDLALLVRQAIGESLNDMAQREGLELSRVVRLVLVANSAMLLLLGQHSAQALLNPHAPSLSTLSLTPSAAELSSWCAAWGLHEKAKLDIISPLEGFTGSDLLASLLAVDFLKRPAGTLFLDLGTNAEMSLWDGSQIWQASAAGGPAFEGSGIRCGAPAGDGAVYRVDLQTPTVPPQLSVIAEALPRGICGSGMVDAVAALLNHGLLNAKGIFSPELSPREFLLSSQPRLTLTKQDIDLFQQAKAAVAGGMALLLQEAGLGPHQLEQFILAGRFGRALRLSSTQTIGLLPRLSSPQVHSYGNTALAGAARLLSPEASTQLQAIRQRIRSIDLSQHPDFEEHFLQNLFLRPQQRTP